MTANAVLDRIEMYTNDGRLLVNYEIPKESVPSGLEASVAKHAQETRAHYCEPAHRASNEDNINKSPIISHPHTIDLSNGECVPWLLV